MRLAPWMILAALMPGPWSLAAGADQIRLIEEILPRFPGRGRK